MSSESPQAKRGKKRTLDEVESSSIDGRHPKRRKLSSSPKHIIVKNDDNENNQNNSHSASTNNNNATDPLQISHHHNNEKHDASRIPNATHSQNVSSNHNTEPDKDMIDLLDSDTPTTNTPDIDMKDIDAASAKGPQQTPQASASANTSLSIIKRDANKQHKYISIYTDKRCLTHCIPDTEIIDEFNERPARLQALLQMIEDESWSTNCTFIPQIESIPTLHDIEGYHSAEYLSDLKNSCAKIYSGNWNVAQGSDTYIVKDTFEAALVSAGLVIEATKHVFSHIPPLPFSNIPVESMDKMDVDQNNNADAHNNNEMKAVLNVQSTQVNEESVKKYAVVLNRPPGHHCDGEKYSGYCFMNNTAVAIEKQLNEDTKVLILDIDVHHGDGTQKLFYAEPTVLTVSFHQYDGNFFPSTGARTEYGPSRRHKAYGTNINVPLGHQASDLDVLYGLRNMVWNIVEKFKPDIAFYAVGTDGVAGDKANNSTIFTPNLYGQIAYELRKYVNLIVVTTEGGYTTDYLSLGMNAVLHGLSDQIDPEYYPEEIRENDVLSSTVHNVAATTSDLRRVYDFEQDPDEIQKIFNKSSQSVESMYIPNDDYEDGDFDENEEAGFDDDEEFFDEDQEIHKKNGKKEKKKKKKDKKKKKKKKHKKEKKADAIDLTANEDKDKMEKSRKRKDKKSRKKKKKHRKKRDKESKHHHKEKRMVSKTVDKKKNKNKMNVEETQIEVIDLIEDSPITNNLENGKKKKKKKKKHKDKKKKRKEEEEEEEQDHDENSSDVSNVNHNQNHNTICTLSGIIGMGITDLAINDISDDTNNKTQVANNNSEISKTSSDVIVIDSE